MGFSLGGVLNTVGGFLGLGPNEGQRPEFNSNYNLPGFNQQYNQYGQLSQQYGNRGAPQARSYTAGGSSFRGDQRALVQGLQADAAGNGPGQQLARMQAQNIADRTFGQQLSAAASARPGMGAAAYQNAAMNAANAQSQVGGNAAMAGVQARLGAMNQLGGVLQGARGQDQELGMFNAQQRQQGSQFNADAQLRQMGLNDQAQLEALRQRLAASQMQQQGGLAYNQHLQNYNVTRMGQPTAGQALLGMAGGLAGGYMQMQGMGGGGGGGGYYGGPPSGAYAPGYNYGSMAGYVPGR